MKIFAKSVFAMLMIFAGAVQATNIIQITVDERAIPFLLDDAGHVWAFRDPHSGLQELIKLPRLEHIKNIAPYIALDDKGQVFTWSLDGPVVNDADEISQTGYTDPQKIESLKGVTSISHSLNHFFAVKGREEIVEWGEFFGRGKLRYNVVEYGPIKNIFSGNGVKAIASAPGINEVHSKPSPYGLIALFDDGTVMGWGVTTNGQVTETAEMLGVVLAKSPGAIGIAINAFHTVILTSQGVPLFFGGCDLYGFDRLNGRHPWAHGHLNGVNGVVSDVIGMALAQEPISGGVVGWGNDNGEGYDVFVRRDGTVWLSHAPLPEGASKFDCDQDNPTLDYRKIVHLRAGKAAALQVATAGGYVFMLDANHELWATPVVYFGNEEFQHVSISLK